jgi:DNA-binding response OmpR family regulator
MQDRLKAVAFDVDPDSLIALRQVFPEWEIETVAGASASSIAQDWNPVVADLLLVGARDRVAETLGLCRGLRSQAGRAQTPLLLLLAPGQHVLASAALQAGAHSCLVLPIRVGTLVSTLARVLAGNRREELWRDDGGES